MVKKGNDIAHPEIVVDKIGLSLNDISIYDDIQKAKKAGKI